MLKPYTIGLDIGTNSVGWAVITEDYKVPTKKMKVLGNTSKKRVSKNLLGSLLFDEGNSAADRRIKRTTRRRYTRRNNRLRYLQEIFELDMKNIDENFFHRLKDSFLRKEDKSWEKHPIFGNKKDEIAYHKEYPTIYHLRKYLADSDEKADLRLVYLALAHIIKYRGHFLIEGEIDTNNNNIEELFEQFLITYNQTIESDEVIDKSIAVSDILSKKISKTQKYEEIIKLLQTNKTDLFSELIKLIVGNTVNFKRFFKLEEDIKLQFSKDDYEKELEKLLLFIGEEYHDIFLSAKRVYDSVLLSEILTEKTIKTNALLSASMIKRYTEHHQDLEKLKQFIKNLPNSNEYDRNIYKNIFKTDSKNGYASYIKGKTTQPEFYDYLKKELKDVENTHYFLDKIEREDFLRKQRTFDNGSIPHQIHLQELRAILDKQSQFYPFLKENKEKIEKIFTFKIPYYVGPLARGNSEFSWVKRITNDKILPWNFDEVVNKEESAESFIRKMTNFDMYLPSERVLPKHSLLYEKFVVLNELTKIRYKDERGKTHFLNGELKQSILENVFKKYRKVTKAKLLDFLEKEHGELRAVDLKGLDNEKQTFNGNLGTYHDFLKIFEDRTFLDDSKNEKKLEEIVHILTIFEDREMIRKRLDKFKDSLDSNILKKLEKRHYTGWGRISAKLINGVCNKVNQKTILDYLLNDDPYNRNFMQLINDPQLSFKQIIFDSQIIKEDSDLSVIVKELAGSPAIKKGILQSLKIVDELIEIMGHLPENIVIEMSRENQTTAKGRKNANERLKKIQDGLKVMESPLLKNVKSIDNRALQNQKLFLYYLQGGKDMYTEESLDINNLQNYDVDHIIPRSFIKDDSIDNLVLTSSKNNRKKQDNVPDLNIVRKMKPYWLNLLNAKLISQIKFDNLTKMERGGLTDNDRAKFISRQLVETRQITKHVARILDERYNKNFDDNQKRIRQMKVITLKSSLVSQFRGEFKLYKVREINHYHHAHDAYLNAVVGWALLRKYPKLSPEFVYGEYANFNINKENKATAKKLIYTNMMKFFESNETFVNEDGEIIWKKEDHIKTIQKVLSYRQVNIVKKVEIQTGSFYKETVQPKGKSEKLIPRKTKQIYLDPEKYGGVDSPNVAYSILIVADVETGKSKKIKTVKKLVGITIAERELFEKDPINFLEKKGYKNIQANKMIKLAKYSLFELHNKKRRLLASASELQKGNELVLPQKFIQLLHYSQRLKNSNDSSYLAYIEEHKNEFHAILEYIEQFAVDYIDAEKNISKIKELMQKFNTESIEKIAESFIQLLALTALGAPSEFKFFNTTIERKRYTSKKDIDECVNGVLIQQSLTGLYETRIDLSKIGEN